MKKEEADQNSNAWGLSILHHRLEDLHTSSIKQHITFQVLALNHLTEHELKAYAIFLQAYLERAYKGKSFESINDIVNEVSERARAIKRHCKRTFLPTTRTHLFTVIKKLLTTKKEDTFIEDGLYLMRKGLIERDDRRVERQLYPELFILPAPKSRKATWKRQTLFPRKMDLFKEGYSIRECSAFVSELAGVPKAFTQLATEEQKPSKEDLSVKQLELECFRLLEELGIIIGDPEVLLSLFSERDLADHLERRRMKNGGVNYGKEIKTKTPAPILDKRR